MSTSATSTQKIADDVLVDLALQGGGAHGAFTWGVLDRLLEEPRLGIDGISGTSAGAMNAAVLADGYTDGGAKGARRALEAFWAGVRLLAGGQHSVERKVVLEDFERRRSFWASPVGLQTIVFAVSALVTRFAWNERFDVPSLRVRQFSPNQDRPPSCDLESHSRVEGNPLNVYRT
jgi:predicted acylesterase/phospholipase RssA